MGYLLSDFFFVVEIVCVARLHQSGLESKALEVRTVRLA